MWFFFYWGCHWYKTGNLGKRSWLLNEFAWEQIKEWRELKNKELKLKNKELNRELGIYQYLMCIYRKRNNLALDSTICSCLPKELPQSRQLRQRGIALPALADVHMDGQLANANTVPVRWKEYRIGLFTTHFKSHKNCSKAKAEFTYTFKLF